MGDSEVDFEEEFVEFFVEGEESVGKVCLLLVLLLNIA